MILHLDVGVREKETLTFNDQAKTLDSVEQKIIKGQIRKNAVVIDSYIQKIHLFVNQEKYPSGEAFVEKLRERMFLLMEENDTFRKVLWRHYQAEDAGWSKGAERGFVKRRRAG